MDALLSANNRTFHRLNNASFEGFRDTRESDRIFYQFTKAAVLSRFACQAAKLKGTDQ